MADKIGISTHKAWALEHYKGMENLLMPSFSPDFSHLDEQGIRLDVKNSIRHGFFSVMATPVGLSSDEENLQFIKTVCSAAKGSIMAGVMVAHRNLNADLEMIRLSEEFRATHLFIWPAYSLAGVTDVDEAYAIYLERIKATRLPVVLYANFTCFKNLGYGLALFHRLADLPNVVAIKLTQPMNLSLAFHVCQTLGDRLLIGPVNLDFVPILAKYCGVQWSGQWNVEAVQTPDHPYAVELMRHLNKGRMNEAMAAFRSLEPALAAFYELQAPLIKKGGHPWAHMKYFQWCGGGNGGLIRETDPLKGKVPILDDTGRAAIRQAYQKAGINVEKAVDASFPTGRAAFSRGIAPDGMVLPSFYKP